MVRREVCCSDLTGRQLDDGEEPVRLVVLEHPDLIGGPVELEARAGEVGPAVDAGLTVAVFELHTHGEEPRRVVVDAGDFDALAADRPMAELLTAATPVKAAGKRDQAKTVNYATLEHAGTPHRGRVTPEEARLVREHLAEVNRRLASQDLRQIDPANPTDAERYGFVPPVPAAAGREVGA